MFKKLSFLLVGLCVSVSTMAHEINLYELLSRGNPAAAITQEWTSAVNAAGFKVDYRAGLGCAGRDAFVQDKSPSLVIVFPGRIWGSLDRGEDTCVIDIAKYQPVAVYEYYNKICTAKGSGRRFEDLLNKQLTLKIGIQPVANPHQYWVDDLNEKYGTKHRTVTAYKNSGDVSRGVMAGDVDFGLFSGVTAEPLIRANKIECFATTDTSKKDSFTNLLPKIHPLLNTYNGSYIVLANNISKGDADRLRSIIKGVNEKMVATGTTNLVVPDLDASQMQKYAIDQVNSMLAVTKSMKKK